MNTLSMQPESLRPVNGFRSVLQATLCAAAFTFMTASHCKAGEVPDNWTFDDDAKTRASHASLEGKPMPSLEVQGWVNGTVDKKAMDGKVVVVDFYATWCGPCMAAIPENNELVKKYRDQGLVLFGVCTSKNGQEAMAQTVKDKGITYPTVRDPELKSAEAWHVQYYPTYAVIDRKGIVRVIGLAPEHVEEVVKKLLAEKS